jgi:hypothetical protein
MKTQNKENPNAPEAGFHKDLSVYASIEELIEEVWNDCKRASRFSWLWKVRSDVLWEAAAAVACAAGGLLTIGHPQMTLAVAGMVPIAIQALRFAAAVILGHGLSKLIARFFH